MTRKLDPKRYADEYHDALEKVIEQKIRHPEKTKGRKAAPVPKSPKIIYMVAVLQDSLAQQSKEPATRRKAKGKAA